MFLCPRMEPSLPLPLKGTTAMAPIQATYESTSGMAGLEPTRRRPRRRSCRGFGRSVSLSNDGTIVAIGGAANDGMGAIRAIPASTNGMAAPGTNSATTLMARLLQMHLAPMSPSRRRHRCRHRCRWQRRCWLQCRPHTHLPMGWQPMESTRRRH